MGVELGVGRASLWVCLALLWAHECMLCKHPNAFHIQSPKCCWCRLDEAQGEAAALQQAVLEAGVRFEEMEAQLHARTADAQGAGLLAAEAQRAMDGLHAKLREVAEACRAAEMERDAAVQRAGKLEERMAEEAAREQTAGQAAMEALRRAEEAEAQLERQRQEAGEWQRHAEKLAETVRYSHDQIYLWVLSIQFSRVIPACTQPPPLDCCRTAEERAQSVVSAARNASQSAIAEASAARAKVRPGPHH